MKVTLEMIAAEADASVSTVSRVLNGHPAISAQTADRVRRAARTLNFPLRQSSEARNPDEILENKTVAIVSLGMDRSLLSLPAVSLAINGVEAELSRRGAQVLLSHVPDLNTSPQLLRTKELAGIVVAGSSQGTLIGASRSKLLSRLRDLPTVWLLGRPEGCWGDAVGSNDFVAGQMAADYLMERGHRRLAFLSPKPDHLVFLRRGAGFLSRATSRGGDIAMIVKAPANNWTLPDRAALTTDAVEPLVHDLLDMSPRPTAVFAAADSVAAAVYRAFAAKGIRVGVDISVMSANNDESLTAGLYPRLTTLDIHAEQIGRVAVDQLARRLADREYSVASELSLAPTLIERDSVSPIS
jgi:LacI family transcriptional regulator